MNFRLNTLYWVVGALRSFCSGFI